jgi:hypothetical protein
MHRLPIFAVLSALLCLGGKIQAGLYYSGETFNELPSQWRGFLLDQRTLRNIAVKPGPGVPASPARQRYLEAAAKLEKIKENGKLTADELADLGALYVRLGEPGKAVARLRPAQRDHPKHFRIAANLGTAWQLLGDLDQAAICLQQAVKLSPGKYQKAEEYHLKLVRLRQREKRGTGGLDDLFGVRYLGENGKYEPGKLSAAQKKKLPSAGAALVQQLALWLPADGRLLWQLAELANVHGDVQSAAAMMDGCVTQFGLQDPELKNRRRLTRAVADELAKSSGKTLHEGHAGVLPARSKRPLVTRLDATPLPPIKDSGLNALPWTLLAETTLDKKYRPTFAKYLQELNGKQVTLNGFLQPLDEELENSTYMLIEYPVGCWYCEAPEVTSIVFVELRKGKTKAYTREMVKVTGKLVLNATDPENFLYTISEAKITSVD